MTQGGQFRMSFDNYLKSWFAHMIQRPEEKPGVAVVLIGGEGTGKDAVGRLVGSLMKPYYVVVNDPDQWLGKFGCAFRGHPVRHSDFIRSLIPI
jgi:hypothetical protein